LIRISCTILAEKYTYLCFQDISFVFPNLEPYKTD
jgi:hypothetical protein